MSSGDDKSCGPGYENRTRSCRDQNGEECKGAVLEKEVDCSLGPCFGEKIICISTLKFKYTSFKDPIQSVKLMHLLYNVFSAKYRELVDRKCSTQCVWQSTFIKCNGSTVCEIESDGALRCDFKCEKEVDTTDEHCKGDLCKEGKFIQLKSFR